MKNPIPDAALDDRLGFVGTAGSGKTYNASGCVERLLDSAARIVVVDPLDVWWGMRLIADGSAPSRYAMPIFGGSHGDLPLNEHAGALIGETVAGMAESCIVSLGGLATKSAERRFMLAFLDAIYRKASGEPVHIIFDEADLWAPQKTSEPMLQSRMEEICRRGRIKGLIPWLITQRPAVISKDVLSQVDGLVAFKLTSSQDRDALEGWIEGQADRQRWKDIRASLPTLAQGEGVVWLPGRGVLETTKFPAKRTFDSSRTPKRGEKKRTAALKPLDLGALKERLAAVEAETKANDPRALKAEIARLTKALASNETPKSDDPSAIEDAEKRGYERGYSTAFVQGVRALGDLWSHLLDPVFKLKEGFDEIELVHDQLFNAVEGRAEGAPSLYDAPPEYWIRATGKWADIKAAIGAAQLAAHTPAAPIQRAAPQPRAASKLNGKGSEQRIIDAIRWWNVLGVPTPSHPQVGFIAGYSHKSGTWATYLSRLRSAGMIEGRGDLVLTEKGLAAANEPAAPPSGKQLRATVLAKIDGPLQRILAPIIGAYPRGLTHSEAADDAGYSHQSGTWATYLSRLRSLDLIEGRGDLKAQGWLFP